MPNEIWGELRSNYGAELKIYQGITEQFHFRNNFRNWDDPDAAVETLSAILQSPNIPLNQTELAAFDRLLSFYVDKLSPESKLRNTIGTQKWNPHSLLTRGSNKYEEAVVNMGGDPRRAIRSVFIGNNGLSAYRIILAIRAYAQQMYGDPKAIRIVVMATPDDRKNYEYVNHADRVIDVPAVDDYRKLPYYNVDLMVRLAKENNCDAIHPGWGFASEESYFPLKAEQEGIIFLGPDRDSMDLLGNKINSLLVYQSQDGGELTVAPWTGTGLKLEDSRAIPVEMVTKSSVRTPEEAIESAKKIGFPVMLKASGAGGGRGMEACYSENDVYKYWEKVMSESDGSHLFVMKMAVQAHAVSSLEEARARFNETLGYPVILEYGDLKLVIKDPQKVLKEDKITVGTFDEEAADFFKQVAQIKADEPSESPVIIRGGGWKHEEVQIVADMFGNVIAGVPRDCSFQVRNQKRLEETSWSEKARLERMMRAAVNIAKATGYRSAGTVEFLTNPQTGEIGKILFHAQEPQDPSEYNLEVNTRVQVEALVTEYDMGMSIVALQMYVAQGIPLHRIPEVRHYFKLDEGKTPEQIQAELKSNKFDFTPYLYNRPKQGHTFALRITAEDSENYDSNGVLAGSSGKITKLSFQSTQDVWGYFSVKEGSEYQGVGDKQLGHLFVHGSDRKDAIKKALVALDNTIVFGTIKTNIPYLRAVLKHLLARIEAQERGEKLPDFEDNRSLQRWTTQGVLKIEKEPANTMALVSALVQAYVLNKKGMPLPPFLLSIVRGTKHEFEISQTGPTSFLIRNRHKEGSYVTADIQGDYDLQKGGGEFSININGSIKKVFVAQSNPNLMRVMVDNKEDDVLLKENDPSKLKSPFPGKVKKILMSKNEKITEGSVVIILEAMKMENELAVPLNVKVKNIKVQVGEMVTDGQVLAEFELEKAAPPLPIHKNGFNVGVTPWATKPLSFQERENLLNHIFAGYAISREVFLTDEWRRLINFRGKITAWISEFRQLLSSQDIPEQALRVIENFLADLESQKEGSVSATHSPLHRLAELLKPYRSLFLEKQRSTHRNTFLDYLEYATLGVGKIEQDHVRYLNSQAHWAEQFRLFVEENRVRMPGELYAYLYSYASELIDGKDSLEPKDEEKYAGEIFREIANTYPSLNEGILNDLGKFLGTERGLGRALLAYLGSFKNLLADKHYNRIAALADLWANAKPIGKLADLDVKYDELGKVLEKFRQTLREETAAYQAQITDFLKAYEGRRDLAAHVQRMSALLEQWKAHGSTKEFLEALAKYRAEVSEDASLAADILRLVEITNRWDKHVKLETLVKGLEDFFAERRGLSPLHDPLLIHGRKFLGQYIGVERHFLPQAQQDKLAAASPTPALTPAARKAYEYSHKNVTQKNQILGVFLRSLQGTEVNAYRELLEPLAYHFATKDHGALSALAKTLVFETDQRSPEEKTRDLFEHLADISELAIELRRPHIQALVDSPNSLFGLLVPLATDPKPYIRQHLSNERKLDTEKRVRLLATRVYAQRVTRAYPRSMLADLPQESPPFVLSAFTYDYPPFTGESKNYTRLGMVVSAPQLEDIYKNFPSLLEQVRQRVASAKIAYTQLQDGNYTLTLLTALPGPLAMEEQSSLFQVLLQRYSHELKEAGLKRVTLCVKGDSKDPYPTYLTFKINGEGVSEDKVYRNIDPYIAYQLEMSLLSNFNITYVEVPDRRIHLFYGVEKTKAQEGPVRSNALRPDQRFFARSVVRNNNISADSRFAEVDEIFLSSMNSIDIARTQREGDRSQGTWNEIYINIIPPFSNQDSKELMQAYFTDLIRQYKDRLNALQIMRVEIRFQIKNGDTRTYNLEFQNFSKTHLLLQVREEREGTTLESQVVEGRQYKPLDEITKRAMNAQAKNTVYVYDWPEKFRESFEKQWNKYPELSRPGNFFTQTELYLNAKGELVEDIYNERKRGDNINHANPALTNGAVGFRIRVKTPEYPEGREIILLALSDINVDDGTIGLKEAHLFQQAAQLAIREGIPFIPLLANTGARFSYGAEVLKRMKVQYELVDPEGAKDDPSNIRLNYLYLSEGDYKAVNATDPEAVTCEKMEVNGEIRYKILHVKEGNDADSLTGSGKIAQISDEAREKIFTMTLVSGYMAVGIGSYLAWLINGVVQVGPMLLTGLKPMNLLLQKNAIKSNEELGGVSIMAANGITKKEVSTNEKGIDFIAETLAHVPKTNKARTAHSPTSDPIDRDLSAPSTPEEKMDSSFYLNQFFDRGSVQLMQEKFGLSVVTGVGTLGGHAMSFVFPELDPKKVVPGREFQPDAALGETESRFESKVINVIDADSALAIGEHQQRAIRASQGMIYFLDFRGFGGNTREMVYGVLRNGSTIVSAIARSQKPVYCYILPNGQLRGGAWVVFDRYINELRIRFYADETAIGSVVEEPVQPDLSKARELAAVGDGSAYRDYAVTKGKKDTLKIGEVVIQYPDIFTRIEGLEKAIKDAQSASDPDLERISQLQQELIEVNRGLRKIAFSKLEELSFLHHTAEALVQRDAIEEIVNWKDARRTFGQLYEHDLEVTDFEEELRRKAPGLKESEIRTFLDRYSNYLDEQGANFDLAKRQELTNEAMHIHDQSVVKALVISNPTPALEGVLAGLAAFTNPLVDQARAALAALITGGVLLSGGQTDEERFNQATQSLAILQLLPLITSHVRSPIFYDRESHRFELTQPANGVLVLTLQDELDEPSLNKLKARWDWMMGQPQLREVLSGYQVVLRNKAGENLGDYQVEPLPELPEDVAVPRAGTPWDSLEYTLIPNGGGNGPSGGEKAWLTPAHNDDGTLNLRHGSVHIEENASVALLAPDLGQEVRDEIEDRLNSALDALSSNPWLTQEQKNKVREKIRSLIGGESPNELAEIEDTLLRIDENEPNKVHYLIAHTLMGLPYSPEQAMKIQTLLMRPGQVMPLAPRVIPVAPVNTGQH